ncbi:GntR family transcriptional regulator [Noviherbaspirillum sp. Root189]|uniref:GntR family transcriptional regulator n=1 Tax=Noviherbaspirillum sp. Root189 TaxID=1736487 RepID=UPI00070EFD15|nr:GntR family transcriptional regulator [Noviherbaspirillum sp. Root189]KRB93560.1 hypothetical protein ASE07_12755 [Noviherbaspirillum sp. Root189]
MPDLNQVKSLQKSIGGRALSQTEHAILGLRDAVLRGQYHAGERLAETDVAEHLGVSRTPVRAAMQRLTEEGLLEMLQPAGFAVREFSEEDIADAIEIRGTLEALAARMAAERGIQRSRLQELRECVARMDAALASPISHCLQLERLARYAEANERFHALILNASGSGMVQRALMRVTSLPFASPNAFVTAQASLPGSLDILRLAQMQHHDIVDALEARSGARIEALMKEHAHVAHKNLQLALRQPEALDHIPGASLVRRA